MSSITRYAVCADPDEWGDTPLYDRYDEAKAAALKADECVVELEYEFSDSSVVDDFRGADEEAMARFIRDNRVEIVAAINGAVYRYDGNGGRGVVPDPAPSYDDDEIRQWIDNDESLYQWAQREGVRV